MTRIVVDSHAIHWNVQGSDRLSNDAASALASAESGDGIVVSVATIVDLRYVTQTTEGVTSDDLARLRDVLTEFGLWDTVLEQLRREGFSQTQAIRATAE